MSTLYEALIDLANARDEAIQAERKAAEVRRNIEELDIGVETMLRDIVTQGTHVAIWREVCARRARKLRKRGDEVRYLGRTKTGKARYRWMRRIAPWAIYMPNPQSRYKNHA